jgi:hypothetical protein
MSAQPSLRAAVAVWVIIAVLAIALCVAVGLVFGQTSLWGTVTAVTTLYIGSIAVWFARRNPSQISGSSRASPAMPNDAASFFALTKSKRPSSDRKAGDVPMEVGSAEFAALIHKLAEEIDDPTDIVDDARRAGIRMSLLRIGGSQTPLSLWTGS